jgi:hypothetical protein
LETPIDSTFTPLVSYTQIVDVGHPKLIAADTIKPYSLDGKRFTGKFTLQEVVVKSSKKKRLKNLMMNMQLVCLKAEKYLMELMMLSY